MVSANDHQAWASGKHSRPSRLGNGSRWRNHGAEDKGEQVDVTAATSPGGDGQRGWTCRASWTMLF